MKKRTLTMAFATAFMLFAGTSLAQIRQGVIGNGVFEDSDGNPSTVYGLDFNDDGHLEFKLSTYSITNDYIIYNWTDGGNNVCNSSMGWDYAAALSQGTAIGPSSNWEGQGDCMVNSTYPSQYFLGFRIRLDDGVHYGWAMVNVSSTELNWVKIYYQATPGMAINAGDEGSSAITEAEADYEISATGNNTIRINADDGEEFRIYDLSGRNVATCHG
ncbi:MAG: hypothetical protein J6W45_09180, partial [Bacteroidales bacterium]|nr:hypothetical protein [Bacteroidales bacterium]